MTDTRQGLTEPKLRTLEAAASADTKTSSWVNFEHLAELAAMGLLSVQVLLTDAGREALEQEATDGE